MSSEVGGRGDPNARTKTRTSFDPNGPLLLEDGRWVSLAVPLWSNVVQLCGDPPSRARGVVVSRLDSFETWRKAGVPALLDTTCEVNRLALRETHREHLGFRGPEALVDRLDALLGAGAGGPARADYDDLLHTVANLRAWIERLGRDAADIEVSRNLAIGHVRRVDEDVVDLASRLRSAEEAAAAAHANAEHLQSAYNVLSGSRPVRWAQRVRVVRAQTKSLLGRRRS